MYGLLMKLMAFIGKTILRSLEKMTQDPRKVQEELLLSILEENKDTEYGRKYGFSEIHSIEEYQKKLPISEYDAFAPYIERMVKGEENVLVKEHIQHYNKTSGALGLAKYIPLSQKQIGACLQKHLLLSNKNLENHFGKGYLAPIQLVLLQRETYMLYRDVMIMRGTSASQLKPLNVVRNEFQRKFLFKFDEKYEKIL